jgi:hypothetical protein
MSGDWRGTFWTLLVTFCNVITRCTETFWSLCIIWAVKLKTENCPVLLFWNSRPVYSCFCCCRLKLYHTIAPFTIAYSLQICHFIIQGDPGWMANTLVNLYVGDSDRNIHKMSVKFFMVTKMGLFEFTNTKLFWIVHTYSGKVGSEN